MNRRSTSIGRIAGWLRHHCVVVPLTAIFYSSGLGDNTFKVKRRSKHGPRSGAWRLLKSFVLLPWRLATEVFRFGRGMVREALFGFGLVRDDVDVSRAIGQGILLRALPVIVAFSSIVGAAVWLSLPHARHEKAMLESLARTAVAKHDYRSASIAYERLAQIDHDNAWTFAWADALDHSGETEVANEMMSALAPKIGAGYAPAQLWFARKMLDHSEIDASQAGEVRMRLARVLELEPENAEANLLMAKLMLNLGQQPAAEPFLVAGASLHPELRLLSAEIGAGLGDREQQHREAAAARDHFQKQLAAAPVDVESRIGLAKASLLLEEYEKSVDLLRTGTTASDAPALREALSEALTAWSLALRNQQAEASRRYELLTEALRQNPGNGAAVVQLLELRTDSSNLREQVDQFVASLDVNLLPALAQVALGNVAWADEDYATARKRFEQAYVVAPDHPGVVNNLAWSLSHSSPLELQRAKDLCDEALRISPLQPNLLDTRSDVLMQLSKWREAQVDLDVLAQLYPGMPGLQDKIDAVRRHL